MEKDTKNDNRHEHTAETSLGVFDKNESFIPSEAKVVVLVTKEESPRYRIIVEGVRNTWFDIEGNYTKNQARARQLADSIRSVLNCGRDMRFVDSKVFETYAVSRG